MDIYHPPSSRYHCIDGQPSEQCLLQHLLSPSALPNLLQKPLDPSPWPPASLSSPEPPCDLQSKSGFMTNSVTAYNSAQSKIYGPRIYGFRVSERARSGPRMQWLRIRPGTKEQLRLGLEYREREQVEEIEGS
ncbi:hypothetical protein PtB15_9B537 [Puccinia triticina]|nr:hypothetical protein PtB15_9B537 [Puccinia triticina]